MEGNLGKSEKDGEIEARLEKMRKVHEQGKRTQKNKKLGTSQSKENAHITRSSWVIHTARKTHTEEEVVGYFT